MTNTCSDECIFISQKKLENLMHFCFSVLRKMHRKYRIIHLQVDDSIHLLYIHIGFILIMFWVFFLLNQCHDDVIKWKHFPRHWTFVRGIHRSPMNSPHKGQWRGALVFSLICAWINGWVNTGKAGDLRRHRAHYDVIVMVYLRHYITHKSIDFHKCISITLHTETHFLMCKPR